MCNNCSKLLPISAFGKNTKFADGLQRICRDCARQQCIQSRKRTRDGTAVKHPDRRPHELERLNRLLVDREVGNGRSCMVSEQRSIAILVKHVSDTLEVRVWQDGTKSDIGLRLLNSNTDCWYPLQLKSSNTEPVKLYLRGKDHQLPIHDLLCIATTRLDERPGAYFFTVEDVANMNIGPSGSLCGFRKDRPKHECKFYDFDALKVLLVGKCSNPVLGFAENELRTQVPPDMQKELIHITLSNRMRPDSLTSWPETNHDVFDQLRNGEREQFKSAHCDGKAFCCSAFSKKMACEKVPYELGDCDWYVFGHVRADLGLYLEWRIPEAALNDWGVLTKRSEDRRSILSAGKMSLGLHLPPLLQERIGGKRPRSDVDVRTAQYVSVLKL